MLYLLRGGVWRDAAHLRRHEARNARTEIRLGHAQEAGHDRGLYVVKQEAVNSMELIFA